MRRAPFDPAPVVADVLHLLAHPDELRSEPLSGCGTCSMTGRLTLPGCRVNVTCHMCHGEGAR